MKVAVSDQFSTEIYTERPLLEKSLEIVRVNGHGPAMQETLGLRNWLPSPASSESDPMAAFHFPSGEQGSCPWQGTLPVFTTWKVLTALPTFSAEVVFCEYRTATEVLVITALV